MNDFELKYKILSTSLVGIEFEFYTDLDEKEITKSLSKAIGKKIIIPVTLTGLDKESKGLYHSEMEPTAFMFKIEKDFSGGKNMFELITGPLVYEESRIIIIKVLQWIKENGWTTDKCGIHLNVNFNDFTSGLKNKIMELNVLHFILKFDEKYVYDRFPKRKNNVYARSICDFYPNNRFMFFERPNYIDTSEYVVPHNKYYGINFTKLPKNYLELRYLGGKNYEKKAFSILEVLDYFIIVLYDVLKNPYEYSNIEMDSFYKKLSYQKKVSTSFSNPELFFVEYPKISVTIDMKGDLEILKSYWVDIRDVLFSLVVDSNLKEGHFNLDTDVSAFQLRDGIMENANNVKTMELFDCNLSGSFSKCDFFRCKIKNSRLNDSHLYESNEVYSSKLTNTVIKPSNYLEDCYVSNNMEVIEGTIKGGVLRKGILGHDVKISKETLIVDVTGAEKKDVESLSNAFGGKNNIYTNDKK